MAYLPAGFLPSIATIGLFTIVGHWNAWFDGILYLNSPDKYPRKPIYPRSLCQLTPK